MEPMAALFIALLTLIVVIVVLWFSYVETRSTRRRKSGGYRHRMPMPLDVGASDTGAVRRENALAYADKATCATNPRTKWDSAHCQCLEPFYGRECELEAHATSYAEVSGISNANLSLSSSTISTPSSDGRLTFTDSTSCTQKCDEDVECVGILWDSSLTEASETTNCLIIRGSVDVAGRIPGTGTLNLYTKGSRPKFTDRIFTSALSEIFWEPVVPSSEKRRLKYWQIDAIKGVYKAVYVGTISQLEFASAGMTVVLLNDTGRDGVMHMSKFRSEDVPEVPTPPEWITIGRGLTSALIPRGWNQVWLGV